MLTYLRHTNYPNYWCVTSQGLSGGIALAWKYGFQFHIMHYTRHIVHILVRSGPRNLEWLLTCMYAANNPIENQNQWQYFTDMSPSVDVPWKIIGDLNFTISDAEKLSCSGVISPQHLAIRHIVNQLVLMDIGISGPLHTWYNHRKE